MDELERLRAELAEARQALSHALTSEKALGRRIEELIADQASKNEQISSLESECEGLRALEPLMREGITGFSRVLVGTSDHVRVYGWVDRCRSVLEKLDAAIDAQLRSSGQRLGDAQESGGDDSTAAPIE
jgi:hypothetical protein